MVFAADTLRDLIEANWSLTAELSKTPADNMKEIVQFFAWPQIMGNEITKAVTVQKMQSAENENVTEHPTYNEVIDVYEITLYYRTYDVQLISRDKAFSDLEDMGDEVIRILKLFFNPSSGTGVFFSARRSWVREDEYNTAQPDLRRRLYFTLTTIESENDEVFSGVNGLLVYDRSQGTGIQPVSDYIYTEVNEVTSNGGFNLIKRLTRDNPGIAKRATGLYDGTFTFETQAKESDIEGATTNFIENIGLLLSNGEVAEVFLIKKSINKNGNTLEHTTRMQIKNIECLYQREDLAKFKLTGEVIQPPTLNVV